MHRKEESYWKNSRDFVILAVLFFQAFGVSVFEDEDEDIYHTEDLSNYDFALGPSNERKSSKKPNTVEDDCIEGFHKATKPLKMKEKFPLPNIPTGKTLKLLRGNSVFEFRTIWWIPSILLKISVSKTNFAVAGNSCRFLESLPCAYSQLEEEFLEIQTANWWKLLEKFQNFPKLLRNFE